MAVEPLESVVGSSGFVVAEVATEAEPELEKLVLLGLAVDSQPPELRLRLAEVPVLSVLEPKLPIELVLMPDLEQEPASVLLGLLRALLSD